MPASAGQIEWCRHIAGRCVINPAPRLQCSCTVLLTLPASPSQPPLRPPPAGVDKISQASQAVADLQVNLQQELVIVEEKKQQTQVGAGGARSCMWLRWQVL